LSVARTEYELDDVAAIDARYPGLSDSARFWFTSAMKLDEVMSPNRPLHYGLSTADGYDGGILPLRRFLDVASLLVPREELRSDGVLRTRLIAVPETRYLDLLGIRTVIAGKAVDVELDGVRYDVATARTLRPGERFMIHLPQPLQISPIGLLASVSEPTDGSIGELVLTRVDGSRTAIPLRLGQEVFGELAPGPVSADQPTAGISRAPRKDSAVQVPVPDGAPVTSMEWTWMGPGTLALRGAIAMSGNGSQQQLTLHEGLSRIEFPTLKLFARPTSETTPLIPITGVRRNQDGLDVWDDASALEWLREATGDELKTQIAVASSASEAAMPGDIRDPLGPNRLPGEFRRVSSTPERIVYRRESEGAPGYLLVPDAWFPGWRAEIDGRSAVVQRANVLFKAVWVPTTAREVVLSYEPASVRIGAMISAVAVLVWLAMMVRGRIGL
jgi:hypothetical protein